MSSYQPCLEEHDGIITDMLIEECLNLIYQEYYDADLFDKTYTGIMKTYINPECPDLMPSIAGKDRINIAVMNYLTMLCLDYTVINKGSSQWPIGGFDFLPKATVALAIHYPDETGVSNYAPGVNLNQAALASLMQIAREIAIDHYNQPELNLQPYDA